IHTFGAKGAIFGTALASGIAVALNLYRIKRATGFKFKQTIKRTLLIGMFIIIMVLVILLLKAGVGWIFLYKDSRVGVTIMLFIGVVGGARLYLLLSSSSSFLLPIFNGPVPIIYRFLCCISRR